MTILCSLISLMDSNLFRKYRDRKESATEIIFSVSFSKMNPILSSMRLVADHVRNPD